jgi:hypothetical protein
MIKPLRLSRYDFSLVTYFYAFLSAVRRYNHIEKPPFFTIVR